MPELPEVETIKNVLKDNLVGRKIMAVEVFVPNLIEFPSLDFFKEQIKKQTINDVRRRGKWIMVELDDYFLLSHLRMEGKYNIKKSNAKRNKHEHVIFHLDNNDELRYHDVRKFGKFHLIAKDSVYNVKPLSLLGLEPNDLKLTASYLQAKFKNKKVAIKTSLLDQTIIVGIGNIYANEVLFLSKISPLRRVCDLSLNELETIINNIRIVLHEAILNKGTTIKSYSYKEGLSGSFQTKLLVHGLENKPCPNCQNPIIKIKVGGRGTYYCLNCQK